MNRLGKTLSLVFAALVLVFAAGITFTAGWHPFIGPRARSATARKFQSTPQRLARGVSHDGRALFPFMPYLDFRHMSDEDLASVIVYLRSLPPVHKQQPTTDLIFPVRYLIRSVPEPLDAPVPELDVSTPEKREKYLVTIAGCTDCHTPQDAHGQPLAGMDFAGRRLHKSSERARESSRTKTVRLHSQFDPHFVPDLKS
jgi:hypothetical protein